MSTGRDGTIIVVQTQGVTPEDDRKKILDIYGYHITSMFSGFRVANCF
jgi:hypothetical protein